MSGHSKWHKVKHIKGALDAKRGAIFTKHAKIIALACQKGGGDPDMNPSLRLAIEKARGDNMPNANIDRAIAKGTGELKEGAMIEEIMYEGFGPAGTALYIQTLTDNKNRTVSAVKNILSKHGGNMGGSGTVAWMFEPKGVMLISGASDKESAELAAIDAGAIDVQIEGNTIEVYTKPTELMHIKKKLEEQGFKIDSTELRQIAKDTIKITDETEAGKVLKLMELLEEDDDVSNVYSNFDIAEELMEKISSQ